MSDFHMNFYPAGYLVWHGQPDKLYPAADAATFVGSSFDIFLHEHFPTLSKKLYGTYVYGPLVAVLFSPFSVFTANAALIIYQLLNLFVLTLGSVKSERTFGINAKTIFLYAFLFFPIAATLWLGQVSLLLGLFPIAAAYFLLQEKRDFQAGLVFSIMFLKPQFLPVPLIISIANKRYRCLAGIVAGSVALLIANIFILTPAIFFQWLVGTLRLAETVFTSKVVIPVDLVACVPGLILFASPPEIRVNAKWIIYSSTLLLALIPIVWVILAIRKKAPASLWLPLTTMLAIFTLPLYSRLLNYDLAIFAFAGLLLLSYKGDAATRQSMRMLVLATWVGFNFQFANAIAGFHRVSPLVFAAMFIMYAGWLCLIVVKASQTGDFESTKTSPPPSASESIE
jgi:hypothetical protein